MDIVDGSSEGKRNFLLILMKLSGFFKGGNALKIELQMMGVCINDILHVLVYISLACSQSLVLVKYNSM